MENPKGFVAFAILCMAVLYCASFVARRRTRFEGSCAEGCIVALILGLAFILGPAYISAFKMARPH